MTPNEYANHRRCHLSTVQEALRAGRIPSARKDARGWWQIDPAQADAEWAATTRADRVPLTGPGAKGSAPAPDYAESRARREAAEAALAELELAKEEGRLVPVVDMEQRIADDYGKVRTKLLGVPSRVRQQDPTITPAQLALLDSVIREALADLAAGEDSADR